jgi:hypothetical protein
MRRLMMGATVGLLVAMLAAPLNAITGNWVEDFEHPFVG